MNTASQYIPERPVARGHTGRRVRADGKPWISFRELEARHERLVAESTAALQAQAEKNRRLGQQVAEVVRRNEELRSLVVALVDSFEDEDRATLVDDPQLGRGYVLWERWQRRQEHAEEGAACAQ